MGAMEVWPPRDLSGSKACDSVYETQNPTTLFENNHDSTKVAHFDFKPDLYAKDSVPSVQEFQEIWKLWDFVSLKMLPTEELLSKPIYLRNCCIFYLGHIPAFLDIQLTKSTGEEATEPAYFQPMFERGIDPDVDNPEKCHAHSEIPDTWPELEEILAYQERVRKRTVKLLQGGNAEKNRTLSKALWLAYEHEAMHLETYLYMLLQSDKILPPPGPSPNFQRLASTSRANAAPMTWNKIAAGSVNLGQSEGSKFWTWDNEQPARSKHVNDFEVRSLPLTNADFVEYLLSTGTDDLPKSWMIMDNDSGEDQFLLNGHANSPFATFIEKKAIRTVYGPVPLLFAIDWPVMGSYDQLAACAKYLGGRIPTMEETRRLHDTVEGGKDNGSMAKSSDAEHLFVDLTHSDVGFKNFHPVPVTSEKIVPGSLAPMSGAWEWTSTVLETWEGFKPMPEYPAYTADFFDGKHNVVLGGSWATLPRIAGRRSFVNWYQRNYPYAWVGARLVRDV